MSINNPIQNSFNELRKNYTSANTIKYVDFLREQPLQSIFENARLLYSEPFRAVVYLNEVYSHVDMSHELIKEQYSAIETYMKKAVENSYDNDIHLEHLKECLETLIEKSNQFNADDEYLKTKLLESYNAEMFESQFVYENHMPTSEEDLDKLIMSVKHNPSLAGSYESFVDKLKSSKSEIKKHNPVTLLVKNTSMFMGGDGTVIPLNIIAAAVVLPFVIVHYIVERRLNKKYAESYCEVIDGEIKKVEKAKDGAGPDKIKACDDYITSLKSAKVQLEEYIKNETKPVVENIVTMGGYDNNIPDSDVKAQELMVKKRFTNLVLDTSMEADTQLINNFMKAVHEYDVVQENVLRNTARKVALGAEKVSRGIVHAARKAHTDTKHVTAVTARVPQHIDNFVSDVLNKIKKMDTDERKKRIIEGGFRVKLFKFIRNAFLVGTAAMINPALAAIGILASVAIDKKLDYEVRKNIVREMESELEIVNEKINDAGSRGEKEKKYQLMRIKSKLEADIQRIKYNLDNAAKG